MRKISFFLLSLFIILYGISVNSTTIAIPAYPHPVEFTQPDGSKLMIKMKGDEYVRWAETLDGFSIMFNKTGTYEYAVLDIDNNMVPSGKQAKNEASRSLKEVNFLTSVPKGIHYSYNQIQQFKMAWSVYETEAINAFPTTGNRNLICILIGYTDVPFTKTNADFNNLFNQINYTTDGATGSVKDCYLENSYNKLNLTITVAGPFTASQTMAYYGADNGSNHSVRAGELIAEAVNAANSTVNYANFDNDNNGSVDGVYVIFAGYGQEAGASANAIWSHASNISTLTMDGKTINKYSCSPEFRGNSGGNISRIGVICHEFGHVLGAPDFYDTNYGTNGQYDGTGEWDLMAGGSWNNGGRTPAHHNAYTKYKVYNWKTPTVLNTASLKTLQNSIDDTASFYRYNTATSNEYFLMENRQQHKFDAFIPGHGLLIYHVDGNALTGAINGGSHQGMYPVCANAGGNPPTTYGTINATGCTFPGSSNKTSFTDTTIPNSKSWAGANTNKPITNITENTVNKTISFAFMGGYSCTMTSVQASNLSFSNLTTSSMTVNCTRGNGNKLLILAKEGSDVFVTLPVGTTYTANSVFGSGQQVGSANYVVYNGSGNSVNISGLNQGTTYYFAAYEYNTAENCYFIPALTGNKTTDYLAPLAAGTIVGDTNVCEGENNVTYIIPAITYATNYTWTFPVGANGYSNSNGININFGNNAVSGYITVTGSNPAGSSNTSSIYVNVNPVPLTPVITQNGNLLISSSTSGNQWYNQSTGLISTDTTYIPDQTGNYYVIVTNNGCESAPSNIITVNITGIRENNENPFAVHIFPNPGHDYATLTYTLDKPEAVSFSLTDITGHEIYKTITFNQNKGEHQFNIDATQLSAGLYIYKLQIGSSLQKGKFIVK